MHAHEHPHCHIHKHSALSINYTFNTKATMLDTPEQKAKLKPQNKSLVHSWNVKKAYNNPNTFHESWAKVQITVMVYSLPGFSCDIFHWL